MSQQTDLKRTTFEVGRELEFFTEKELQMQIGHDRELWPAALLKELIDNSLDACESVGTAPVIEVKIEADTFSVQDSGPGLPRETLEKSLDYMKRVSDKNFYVSPSRGQMGNALKVLWAGPFVVDGEHGCVEVFSSGSRFTIDVSLDRVEQRPRLELAEYTDPLVKNGARVLVRWPGASSCLFPPDGDFYKPMTALELVEGYAAFNPHANFKLGKRLFKATKPDWQKWRPSDPISPHWYTVDTFRDLIAAYIASERQGGKRRTVREFVSEFRGLSATAKQKSVTSGMSGLAMVDLVEAGDISTAKIEKLLAAMQKITRPPKVEALGVLGENHFRTWLQSYAAVAPSSIHYAKYAGDDGLPFVVEVGFGVSQSDNIKRRVLAGLNFSPALGSPVSELDDLLGEMRLDKYDPVVLLIHLACPRFQFVDRGKTRLKLSPEMAAKLEKAIQHVAKAWKAAKRREDRISSRELSRLRSYRPHEVTLREAAFEAMATAYKRASSDGRYFANARQIMYAARPMVLEMTGGKVWKDSAYFTQRLLKDYLEDNDCQNWKVVWDARGHLTEPHTGKLIGLGGVEVDEYTAGWTDGVIEDQPMPSPDIRLKTLGPKFRFGAVLFIEKEGFSEILESTGVADRYDVSIMSTKGIPVAAACNLAARFEDAGVKVLVLHDFDSDGFKIVKTLREGTRLARGADVIDIGLRLADVEGLESEPVEYKRGRDPRRYLARCGATEGEREFLVSRQTYAGWSGKRVELNAMTSEQLVTWLEDKLNQHGVTKLIPERKALDQAYRRAAFLKTVEAASAQAVKDARKTKFSVPRGLRQRIAAVMAEDQNLSWDEALWTLVPSGIQHKAG